MKLIPIDQSCMAGPRQGREPDQWFLVFKIFQVTRELRASATLQKRTLLVEIRDHNGTCLPATVQERCSCEKDFDSRKTAKKRIARERRTFAPARSWNAHDPMCMRQRPKSSRSSRTTSSWDNIRDAPSVVDKVQ